MKRNFKIRNLTPVFVIVVTVGVFVFSPVIAQNTKNGDKTNSKTNPQINIKVTKKTDKNGNLTQYDSTYTWSWSSDQLPQNMDSVFNNFRSDFNFNFDIPAHPDSLNFSFNFSNDSDFFSVNMDKFFKDDFMDINKMFEEHEKMMRNFFKKEPILKAPNDIKDNKDQKQEQKLRDIQRESGEEPLNKEKPSQIVL